MQTDQNDKFGEFLKEFTPKFGAAVLGLGDSIRLDAIEQILIQHKITTKDEIDLEVDKAIDKLSETLRKAPLPPIPSPFVNPK